MFVVYTCEGGKLPESIWNLIWKFSKAVIYLRGKTFVLKSDGCMKIGIIIYQCQNIGNSIYVIAEKLLKAVCDKL